MCCHGDGRKMNQDRMVKYCVEYFSFALFGSTLFKKAVNILDPDYSVLSDITASLKFS